MLNIIVVALGIVSATGWAAPKDQKKMTDQQITNAIEYKLLTDSAMINNQIDAKVNDGIVTLSGMADYLMVRERAGKLAQTIRGVRGVVNTILLKPSVRPDDKIRNDVDSALSYVAATESYRLKPVVKAGVVTLSGAVQSYGERQLAMYVTKGVKGVKEVKDSIIVTNRSERPDTEIATEVKRALAIDVWLEPTFINTEVKDGVVTLSGTVGSSAQYGRASQLAWTAGVKSVHTGELKIEPWAKVSGQRKETVVTKSDPQIKQAVHDAFIYDPRVFSFNPSVDVEFGVVTLTGTVNNLKAKRAAEQDTKNTVGVWLVKNLLKVRSPKPPTDEKVAQNVKAALLRDPVVEGYPITARAMHGVVTLTGTVDSFFEKAEAEDVASRAKGAIDVKNNLKVSYPTVTYYSTGYDPYWSYQPYFFNRSPYAATWPYSSDAEVKNDIEDVMFWSPWVDRDDITVKVANGVATLTGTANSWFEFNKATENAYEGGATQVYNNIAVR